MKTSIAGLVQMVSETNVSLEECESLEHSTVLYSAGLPGLTYLVYSARQISLRPQWPQAPSSSSCRLKLFNLALCKPQPQPLTARRTMFYFKWSIVIAP